MTPDQIASAINDLPAAMRKGVASVFGDHLPRPLASGVEIQSATALLDETLLLKFKNGWMVSIRNPGELSLHDKRIQVASGEFLRLESFLMQPPRFLWEYSHQSNTLYKSIDGGEPVGVAYSNQPAFALKIDNG